MKILGISAFYHDSAAALLVDGEICAAAQEERFSRIKNDASFPRRAVEFCLAHANISLSEVDYVAFYDKPLVKFERLLETYLALAPRGFASFSKAMPLWVKEKLFQKNVIGDALRDVHPQFPWRERLLFAEHHQSHAASAFFPSPFDRALVLTMDGVGEWATTSAYLAEGNRLRLLKEIRFPHSLGLLYAAFTAYAGFKVNSGEYKLMGLAPYGEPRFVDLILEHLIDVKDDGSFRPDQRYFDYCTGLRMTNRRFHRLFGAQPREAAEELTQFHMDIAASIQKVTEMVLSRMTRALARESGQSNLCLAGGVALNCVANGKLVEDGDFEQVWIQPAAGDAGGALGAAYCAAHFHLGAPRERAASAGDRMHGAYLGPAFGREEIARRLAAAGAAFERAGDEDLVARTARALVDGQVVGWFQGRMEFGPRALGNRSIIGDPRSPRMQKLMNLKIKYRESFRPFAPSVLREDLAAWFELDVDSPYMLLVARVRADKRLQTAAADDALFGIDRLNVQRSLIPAVTHVDYSARIQTVHRETNPLYHALISRFRDETGCPVLVNTSFNVRGEPIVCTPEDAFRCFMGTEIDLLVAGDCLLAKVHQDPALLGADHRHQFALD